MTDIDWVAADWGTSRLRVWGIDRDDAVIVQASSQQGMASLGPGQFEAALLKLIDPWLAPGKVTPVLACGMVGARQGWIEAPYAPVPSAPFAAAQLTRAPGSDKRIDMRILAGLSQAKPADVMRGEETQIAGLLVQRPGFDGAVCMPGTHTKWVQVADGRILSFQSCMTGELFSLLEKHSVLKHSLQTDRFDQAEFEATVSIAVDNPQAALMNLFAVRAADLLEGAHPEQARARLSAWLIGAEVGAAKVHWQTPNIVLTGEPELVGLYRIALHAAGATSQVVDGERLTLLGLCAAKAALDTIDGQ